MVTPLNIRHLRHEHHKFTALFNNILFPLFALLFEPEEKAVSVLKFECSARCSSYSRTRATDYNASDVSLGIDKVFEIYKASWFMNYVCNTTQMKKHPPRTKTEEKIGKEHEGDLLIIFFHVYTEQHANYVRNFFLSYWQNVISFVDVVLSYYILCQLLSTSLVISKPSSWMIRTRRWRTLTEKFV